MSGKPETIKLGGRTFEYRPLKLGEMRPLEKVLGTAAATPSGIDFAARVMVAALPDAKLSEEDVLNLEAPRYELEEAAQALLRLAGWDRPATGESRPQAAD